MATSGDNSYLITGKVCPPKLPMHNLMSDGRNGLSPSLLEQLFTEISEQGKQTSSLNPLSALSFQASVWLSTDGLSSTSVVCLPYFFCNFCDYHTDSKTQLLRHVGCKHVFKCELCDFISTSRHELVQHQLHKHLDAEEMQPVLGCKMVHLNLSLLQRNLKNLAQSDNGSNNLASSDGRRDNFDVVNSSQMKISKVRHNIHEDSQEFGHQENCNPIIIKEECPDTSSKCKAAVNPPVISESVSEQDWTTDNISKRCCSKEKLNICERSTKKLKKDHCSEHPTKSDVFGPNQDHSFQMPHFLDESDSNVTSSCSPYKNTLPVMLDSSRTNQTCHKTNHIRSQDAHSATGHSGRVLSFFMESISSSASIESTELAAACDDKSVSPIHTIQKTLHWCNDHGDGNVFKYAGCNSPFVSQAVMDYPKNDSSSFLRTSRSVEFQESEKSHHSEFSSLSRKGLLRQQGKSCGSNDLFSESSRELPGACQKINHVLSPGGSAASKNSGQFIQSAFSVSSENIGDVCERKQSDRLHANSQKVDNFLVTPADNTDEAGLSERRKEDNTKTTLGENGCESYVNGRLVGGVETHSSGGDGFKYDLLRKLLIGTTITNKHMSAATSVNPEIDERQSEASLSKGGPLFDSPQSNRDRCEPRNQLSLLTRASDMSLKDLLTQGPESIPDAVFYTCSYCNLKSSCKGELQRHVETCKSQQGSERAKIHKSVYGISGKIISLQDSLNEEAKATPSTSVGILVDDLYSSEKFMASEVLKTLSEHYSESLGGDTFFQDKSQTPESQLQIGEPYSLLDGQICHEIEGNGKQLRHRPARRRPDVDYVYDSGNSSSSYNSDSDYKPNSAASNVRKKNKRKHNTQSDSAPNKRSDTKRLGASQCLEEKDLPLIHHSCLWCDFTTYDRANMQDHSIRNHTDYSPFAGVYIPGKGNALLYFCRGRQSECMFYSSEAPEMFEHIKICYYGHLDNFSPSDNVPLSDYSQVLRSLGEVSKFIDYSPVMFYCLRCSFSRPDFQQVSGHVSISHANLVAGVLCVDKVRKEPRVGMVCLMCSAHVSVMQWPTHACRMRAVDGCCKDAPDETADDPLSPKLETKLGLSGTPSCQKSGGGSQNVMDLCGLTIGSKKNCINFEDCKPDIGVDHNSTNSLQTQTLDSNTASQKPGRSFESHNFVTVVNIKQEIPEANIVDEEFADIPVHFSEYGHTEEDRGGVGDFQVADSQIGCDTIDQKMRMVDSPQACSRKAPSGSSVLQSLLIAPRDPELAPKSYSLLHSLLKADTTVKEKQQHKAMSAASAESTSGSANTHSQYPCILGMLSRQDCTAQETSVPDSVSCPSRVNKLQKDSINHCITNLPSPGLMPASSSPSASPQLSINTKCLPNLSISAMNQPSSVHELSPPLIPHPPQLPLLPPLSPSPPPSSPATTGSQDTPGPFANLLRLLSKTKFNSDAL